MSTTASSSKRRKPEAKKDDPRKKEKYADRKKDRQKVAAGKRAKEEAEEAAEESRKKLAKEQDERDFAAIEEAMGAEEATEGEKAKKAAPPAKEGRQRKDPNAPKGPRPARIYYQIEVRSKFVADHSDKNSDEVNKLINQSWKKLSDEAQRPYKELAAEDRLRHKKEVAAYGASKPSSDDAGEPGAETASSALPAKKGRKKKDPNAPKGPRPARNYYQIEVRSQFNADNPGMKAEEVNKLINQSWKKLTSDEQQPYKDLTAKDKVRHKREVAEYEARKAAEEMARGTRSRDENALVALATVQRQWETVDAAEAAVALDKAAGGSSKEGKGRVLQTLYTRVRDAKKVLLERQKEALEWLVGDDECETIRDGIDGLATYSNEQNHLEDPKTTDQYDWESDLAFAFRKEYDKLNSSNGKLRWKKRWLGEQRRHLKEKIAGPLASRPAVLDAAKIAFREEFDFDQSIHAVLSAQSEADRRWDAKRKSEVAPAAVPARGRGLPTQIVGLGYRLTVSDGDVRGDRGRGDKRDRVCDELNSILGSNMTFNQRLSSAEELVGAMTVMKF